MCEGEKNGIFRQGEGARPLEQEFGMIVIGNFLQLTNQKAENPLDRRHGEFSLMVEAADTDSALGLFREKIQSLRITSDFFEGHCRIYLIQMMEFDAIPTREASMVNFRSVAGDPLMPFIDCVMPNDVSHSCRIVEWTDATPEVDEGAPVVFVEFEEGGAA